MTETLLELSCRDPIVARDGRPFGAGTGRRMRSLPWPTPSLAAGSLRTALGKAARKEFSDETAADLLRVSSGGLYPVANGKLYLPAPQDCVPHPKQGALRAMPGEASDDGEGCDLPTGLRPVGLSQAQAPEDFKPDLLPAWWPMDLYADWLAGKTISFSESFLCAPAAEYRTHVQLRADTGAADEGMLFTTAALPLSHLPRYGEAGRGANSPITLAMRVRAEDWCSETAAHLRGWYPLGGERRLAHWQAARAPEGWECPEKVRKALQGSARVRMVLATPAIFRHGWKPGWLGDDLTGKPPGGGVTLRLLGVNIARWEAISGWSLAEPRGPKPVRRVVPAGGVYFFEVSTGAAGALGEQWLEAVSDEDQDRRDGFGLATWGVW